MVRVSPTSAMWEGVMDFMRLSRALTVTILLEQDLFYRLYLCILDFKGDRNLRLVDKPWPCDQSVINGFVDTMIIQAVDDRSQPLYQRLGWSHGCLTDLPSKLFFIFWLNYFCTCLFVLKFTFRPITGTIFLVKFHYSSSSILSAVLHPSSDRRAKEFQYISLIAWNTNWEQMEQIQLGLHDAQQTLHSKNTNKLRLNL